MGDLLRGGESASWWRWILDSCWRGGVGKWDWFVADVSVIRVEGNMETEEEVNVASARSGMVACDPRVFDLNLSATITSSRVELRDTLKEPSLKESDD